MKRFLVAAFALVASALSVVPPAFADASITALGWWSRRPGAMALEEGSVEVALAPDGPLSKAAVRITSSSISDVVLELTESEAVLVEVAGIYACPGAASWTPANPGAWADAPADQCASQKTEFSRSGAGIWSADITSFLSSGTSTVALVPFSPDGAPVAFRVVLGDARLDVTDDDSSTPPPLTQPTVIAPSLPPEAQPTEEPEAQAPTSAPAPTAAPVPSASPPPQAFAPSREDDGEPQPWGRLAFGLPICIALGVGATVLRRTARDRGWMQS